jgi:hypothetical protein
MTIKQIKDRISKGCKVFYCNNEHMEEPAQKNKLCDKCQAQLSILDEVENILGKQLDLLEAKEVISQIQNNIIKQSIAHQYDCPVYRGYFKNGEKPENE